MLGNCVTPPLPPLSPPTTLLNIVRSLLVILPFLYLTVSVISYNSLGLTLTLHGQLNAGLGYEIA